MVRRVLLVTDMESFGSRIQKELQRDFEIVYCQNTAEAVLVMDRTIDAMILQLELPGIDGLTFLSRLPFRPAVILPLASNFSPYTAQRLYDLGAGYLMRTPCAADAVADRFRDMMRDRDYIHKDPQSVTASHLSVLGIHSEYGGGKHLRVGIPLFAQDPGQKLSMELYPAIGQLCGTSGGAVEHAIREVIQKAWDQHDEGWTEYFPTRRRCPSNKVFISALAEKLWQG